MNDRFEFGKNWQRFLSTVTPERIDSSTSYLGSWLGDLSGLTFLDIGSGSGLDSLSALRLGASRVVSFDYDPESVACTREMKRRFDPHANWTIEQGSALDEAYVSSLGSFDVVNSWGVLHHTGDLKLAMEIAAIPAKDRLLLGIYNDQGATSTLWRLVKRTYVAVPPVRPLLAAGVYLSAWGTKAILSPRTVIAEHRNYHDGMSPWHDAVDWAGGYPFEVAKPDQVIEFYRSRGYQAQYTKLTKRLGLNKFLFRKRATG